MTPSRSLSILMLVLVPLAASCDARDDAGATNGATTTAITPAAPAQAWPDPADASGTATADTDARPARVPDVIYVPTPQPVVDAMLNMAQVRTGDVLYDLGSGDGRIPITAASRFKVRGTGIEINPERIAEANANAAKAGVADLVTFKEEDLFETDFSDATVVTLYLLDSLNEKLRPRLLAELAPGTRIVSHAFRMGDWEPEETLTVGNSTIFLWTVPAR